MPITNVRDLIVPKPVKAPVKGQRIVSPFTVEGVLQELESYDTGYASAVWIANAIVYTPITLNDPMVVEFFWWDNGATTLRGQSDVGIYSLAGVRLAAAGGTLNTVRGSGTTRLAPQIVYTPRFLLQPGLYWLAYSCNSSTHTINRANPSPQGSDAIGFKQQLSGWALNVGHRNVTGELVDLPDPLADPTGTDFHEFWEGTQMVDGLPLTATFATPTAISSSDFIVPMAGFGGSHV